MKQPQRLAIVDIETTGASPTRDRIIEISILIIENDIHVSTYKTLVDPECYIPPSIHSITGITLNDVRRAPTFNDIKDEVYVLLQGSLFVAHNARFDYGFIKNEFSRLGIRFQAQCLCTVRLSKLLFPQYRQHDLSSLIDRFNFTCTNRHRAYDDALVVWNFIETTKSLFSKKTLDAALDRILKTRNLPQHITESSINDLPESAGVYIFYGIDGETLYIGKSKNIRTRVLSHFSRDHASAKEMAVCQQTADIETFKTDGELGALLLEAKLIKEKMPLYNRFGRKKKELFVLRKHGGKNEYSRGMLERVKQPCPEDMKNIYALFKSAVQAKRVLTDLCREYGLCPKLLGIEKGEGECFNHQINKCSGACASEIPVRKYNSLFESVFKSYKLKTWPYKHPILIEERNPDSYSGTAYLIDNWLVTSHIRYTETEEEQVDFENYFDYDQYKIISQYISSHPNKVKRAPQKLFAS